MTRAERRRLEKLTGSKPAVYQYTAAQIEEIKWRAKEEEINKKLMKSGNSVQKHLEDLMRQNVWERFWDFFCRYRRGF